MRLIIRASWVPGAADSVEKRIEEAVQALQTCGSEALVKPVWFDTGRSKADALKRRYALSDLTTKRRPWRRVPLVAEEAYWSLSLWNGEDSPRHANFRITIYDPPSDPDAPSWATFPHFDSLFLETAEAEFLKDCGLQWQQVLGTAECFAQRLGGLCIVASHDLWEASRSSGWPDSAPQGAYAAFWGADRSGKNPLYKRLPDTAPTGPYATIACRSWEEVQAPRLDAIHGIARLVG